MAVISRSQSCYVSQAQSRYPVKSIFLLEQFLESWASKGLSEWKHQLWMHCRSWRFSCSQEPVPPRAWQFSSCGMWTSAGHTRGWPAGSSRFRSPLNSSRGRCKMRLLSPGYGYWSRSSSDLNRCFESPSRRANCQLMIALSFILKC